FLAKGIQAIASVSAAEQAALRMEQHQNAWRADREAGEAATAMRASEAATAIAKAYDEVKKAVDTVGMTDAGKKVYEIKQKFGELTPEVQTTADAVAALGEQLKDLKKHEKEVE